MVSRKDNEALQPLKKIAVLDAKAISDLKTIAAYSEINARYAAIDFRDKQHAAEMAKRREDQKSRLEARQDHIEKEIANRELELLLALPPGSLSTRCDSYEKINQAQKKWLAKRCGQKTY
ncbi:MAG: hypothetical protein AAFO95_05410 [Cyanobacteria bacterium J06600_6]